MPLLRTYPFIRIWHAGCSTGEEVYSTAIVLEEEGLLDRARIYATDINDAVLQQARGGIFPLNRMQEYTENYIRAGGTRSFSEYYTAKYDGALFSPSLTRNVVFSQHNLVTDRSFSEFNVIFCRNVLIYFDRDAAEPRAHAVLRKSRDVRHPRAGQQGVAPVLAVRGLLREAASAREAVPEGQVVVAYDDRRRRNVVGRTRRAPRADRRAAGAIRAADRRRAAPAQGSDHLLPRVAAGPNVARACARSRTRRRSTPGNVYVAPADYHLLVEDGYFSLSTDAPVRFSRPSIDVTFESAADAYGERAVGVVLTGANADGARGLRRIADRGGLALVQTPATAESPAMPAARASRRARSARALDDSPRSRRRSASLPATPRGAARERLHDDAPTQTPTGRHPPRRRPAGESARARGDPRAARPAARARVVRRRRAALSARARLRRHPARRADAGHERLRDGAADQVARADASSSRSSSSPRSARTRSTSSRATRSARSTTCSSRSSRTILRSKVQVFVELYLQQRRIAEQEQQLREGERRELELRHMRELVQSEARFREIVGTAMDAIVVFDVGGTIKLVQRARPSACSARRRPTRSGQPIGRFFPDGMRPIASPSSARRRPHASARSDRRDRSRPQPLTARRATGETFPIEASVSCLDSPDGTHLHAHRARRLRARCAHEEALKQQAESLAAVGDGAQAAQRGAAPAAARSRARDDGAQPLLRVDEPRAAHADQRRARLQHAVVGADLRSAQREAGRGHRAHAKGGAASARAGERRARSLEDRGGQDRPPPAAGGVPGADRGSVRHRAPARRRARIDARARRRRASDRRRSSPIRAGCGRSCSTCSRTRSSSAAASRSRSRARAPTDGGVVVEVERSGRGHLDARTRSASSTSSCSSERRSCRTAPASGCRSRAGSPSCSTARSRWSRRSGRGARSACDCRTPPSRASPRPLEQELVRETADERGQSSSSAASVRETALPSRVG